MFAAAAAAQLMVAPAVLGHILNRGGRRRAVSAPALRPFAVEALRMYQEKQQQKQQQQQPDL
jgi:hypothetical protein